MTSEPVGECEGDAPRDGDDRFRMFFEQSPDAVFVEDLEGNILDVNPAGCLLHGMQREDLIGRNVEELVPPDAREAVRRDFPKWTNGELSYYEGFSLTSDGRRIPVEIRASRIVYRNRAALLLNVRDITARKASDDALRRSEEQLRQAQKMEALGRLAGGIAHDFNNLLTTILGFSDLILESVGPTSRISGDLKQIVNAARRAADLTRRLLAFGRTQIVQVHPLNPNRIVLGIDGILRRTLGEDIDLETVPGANIGTVEADAGQLEQVLMNLAVNARDAMPRGGTLTIRTARAQIPAGLAPDGVGRDSVMLLVRDTGCGMSEAVQAHLFEPFFTTKPEGRGTGLGLSTVYGIVRQLGGGIEVESAEGKGTEFRIYLPRLDSPDEALARLPEGGRMPRGRERILVVEDEDPVRVLTVRMLESLGYVVLAASNAAEALLFFERADEPIDLVLSDVVMPKVSGRELTDRLRKIRADVKILYMTGFTQDDVVRHGLGGRKTPVILKPFSREELAAQVRGVLDAR